MKKRIVFKFGTGILANTQGRLDRAQIRRLASDVCDAVDEGYECIVVSSGAIGAGVGALGLPGRPTDVPTRQACAAVGQTLLMQAYQSSFARRGIHAAQMLLTHHDLDSRTRLLNASRTLERLFREGRIVPVINENDVVAVEEIRELRIGDNDQLSVDVALLAKAHLLVLLTSVDGVFQPEAKKNGKPRLIRALKNAEDALPFVHSDSANSLSVGGMASKLRAAGRAARNGLQVIIANGRRPGQIPALLAGKPVGTIISPVKSRVPRSTSDQPDLEIMPPRYDNSFS